MNQGTTDNRARRASAVLANPLKRCLAASALTWGLAAAAQTSTMTMNFTVGATVPDGDKSGLASVQSVATPITNLTGLKVTLKLSGTWNGDLYCYLTHGTGQAVLLNRVGRGSARELGYNDAGLEVTFDDAAANGDIHNYRLQLGGSQDSSISGPLSGVWAPDARVASPVNVLDTDPRAAFLGAFQGLDPNGEWVLLVADLEGGDLHVLESWGLEITGESAPIAAAQTLAQSTETTQASATLAGQGTSPVAVQVGVSTPAAPAVLTGITVGAGGARLTFRGSAGYTYQVERAASLQGGKTVWTNIGVATTDNAGRGELTDAQPPAGQGFYRAVWQ